MCRAFWRTAVCQKAVQRYEYIFKPLQTSDVFFIYFFSEHLAAFLHAALVTGVDGHAGVDGLGVKPGGFLHGDAALRRHFQLYGAGHVGSLVGVAHGGDEVEGAVVVEFCVVVGEAHQCRGLHELLGHQLTEVVFREGALHDGACALADDERHLVVVVVVALRIAHHGQRVCGHEVILVGVGLPRHAEAVCPVQFAQADDACDGVFGFHYALGGCCLLSAVAGRQHGRKGGKYKNVCLFHAAFVLMVRGHFALVPGKNVQI